MVRDEDNDLESDSMRYRVMSRKARLEAATGAAPARDRGGDAPERLRLREHGVAEGLKVLRNGKKGISLIRQWLSSSIFDGQRRVKPRTTPKAAPLSTEKDLRRARSEAADEEEDPALRSPPAKIARRVSTVAVGRALENHLSARGNEESSSKAVAASGVRRAPTTGKSAHSLSQRLNPRTSSAGRTLCARTRSAAGARSVATAQQRVGAANALKLTEAPHARHQRSPSRGSSAGQQKPLVTRRGGVAHAPRKNSVACAVVGQRATIVGASRSDAIARAFARIGGAAAYRRSDVVSEDEDSVDDDSSDCGDSASSSSSGPRSHSPPHNGKDAKVTTPPPVAVSPKEAKVTTSPTAAASAKAMADESTFQASVLERLRSLCGEHEDAKVLAEYIVVMVAGNKNREEMAVELGPFFPDQAQAETFVDWVEECKWKFLTAGNETAKGNEKHTLAFKKGQSSPPKKSAGATAAGQFLSARFAPPALAKASSLADRGPPAIMAMAPSPPPPSGPLPLGPTSAAPSALSTACQASDASRARLTPASTPLAFGGVVATSRVVLQPNVMVERPPNEVPGVLAVPQAAPVAPRVPSIKGAGFKAPPMPRPAPRNGPVVGSTMAAVAPPPPQVVVVAAPVSRTTKQGKNELLEAMTRQLQQILAKLHDKGMTEDMRERYQAMAQSIQTQIAKISKPQATTTTTGHIRRR